MAPITDQPGLPRVLLIGDSISIGYTLQTRKLLSDVANVHRIPANGGSTKVGVRDLDRWLGAEHWDVIHFNFGVHDVRRVFPGDKFQNENGEYPNRGEGAPRVNLQDYEANLRVIIDRLKRTGAKLIFATTTPLTVDYHGYPAGEEIAYNRVACQVMKETGVTVNDLHALVFADCPAVQTDKVHFNLTASHRLAEAVAAAVRQALTPSGPPLNAATK
jgi:acyl-CoA thioesterase-1